MKQFLAAFCLFCVSLFPLPAASQSAEIRSVIRDQIEAMRTDDFATAFTYASPGIRRYFGTSDRFSTMVQQGYPMVHNPKEMQFLGLQYSNGRLVQRLMVQDSQGNGHVLDYFMIQTDQGWKIDGVQIVPPKGQAV